MAMALEKLKSEVDDVILHLEVNYLSEFCQRSENEEEDDKQQQVTHEVGVVIKENGVVDAAASSEEEEEVDVESVDEAPPSFWSWDTTFDQRQFNMLQFGFMTDFVVVVKDQAGTGDRQIGVHKAVLASSSTQFYSQLLLLLGRGAEEIDLTDEDSRSVVLFLRYLYVGDSGVSSVREAVMLHRFAEKYQVPDLVQQMTEYMRTYEFNLESAIAWLPFALYTSNRYTVLEENVMNCICKNGEEFLASKKFYRLQPKLVLEIVKRDDLNVKFETSVMHAVINWGQAQCKKDKPKVNEKHPDNFGPYIAPFLPHIRFPINLNPVFWFSKDSKPDQVLQQIFFTEHTCVKYNPIVRKYSKPFNLLVTRYDDENGVKSKLPLTQWNCKDPRLRFRETLMIQVNMSFIFYGIGLVPGIMGENFKKNVYNYTDMSAHVIIIISSETIIPKLDLLATNDNRLRIHFKEPIDLPPHKWIMLIIQLAGNLQHKPKNSKDKWISVPLSSCSSFVGMGMRAESDAVFTPVDANMLIPMSCQFRRASAGADQFPIDKGFINTLWFSLNKPHPEDKNFTFPLNITPHLLMELEVTEAICGAKLLL